MHTIPIPEPTHTLGNTQVQLPDTVVQLCRAHYNHAAMFDSMSHFFSRDNVGLPGVSLYFKVGANYLKGFLLQRCGVPVLAKACSL